MDGIYVKAGLEIDKAALLVLVGARADGTKEVLAVECGQRESEASWSCVLRGLKARGMNYPRLVMGDGHLGIWAALAGVYSEADEQRCWNHRMRNILDRVGKKKQGAAKELLSKVMYAPTKGKAEAAKSVFQAWARSEQHEQAASLLEEDWDRMVTYYSLPRSTSCICGLQTWSSLRSPVFDFELRHRSATREWKAPRR